MPSHHRQVRVRVGDWEADVDAGAAHHVRRLWYAGVPTRWSCQGSPAPRAAHRALIGLRSALWRAGDALLTAGNVLADLARYTGGPYVMVDRAEDVDLARELLPPRYDVVPPPTPAEVAEDAPTHEDLYVTTATMPRTRFAELLGRYEVTCGVPGWCLLRYDDQGAQVCVAGELHPEWLVLDVDGWVILDSRRA